MNRRTGTLALALLAAPSLLAAQSAAAQEAAAQEPAPEDAAVDGDAPAPDEATPPGTADRLDAPASPEGPSATLATSAALFGPGTVSPAESEFEQASELLGLRSGPWVLDDGLGPEVTWNDYDPVSDYTPEGLLHAGVQLRMAALPGGTEPAPDGPLVELGFFGDVRFGRRSPWHLRLVLALAYQPHGEDYLGGGVSRVTSPFAAKVRILPIALDIGNWVAVRAGPEVGVQWIPRPGAEGGTNEIFGAGTAEIVLRLLGGHLEVGLAVGLQFTAYGQLSRPNVYRSELTPEAVVGAQVGGML